MTSIRQDDPVSIRIYHPTVTGKRRSRNLLGAVAWVLALATIGAQIAYPLISGENLRLLTIATVYVGAAAALVHAWYAYGLKYASIYALVTWSFGTIIEMLGVNTGWPFGEYSYSWSLGYAVAGVPVVVPFAWVMMAHPIFVAARSLNERWAIIIAAWGLVAWDIFLDPLMVDAGHWTWARTTPHLIGVSGIPLSNFAGWLLSGLILFFLLDLVLLRERRSPGSRRGPVAALLMWTYFSGIVGNLFFFDRPGLALTGGLALGVIAIPYTAVLWWSRQ